MASYTRQLLSGSTNGKAIAVAATATPGTAVHTAITNGYDEIYLWAVNRTASVATLTVEFGGVANSDHVPEAFSIPPNSPPIPILTGQVLNGGLSVAAFSGTASAINVVGFVNRIE